MVSARGKKRALSDGVRQAYASRGEGYILWRSGLSNPLCIDRIELVHHVHVETFVWNELS